MTAFHEVRFPTAISYESTGGPERKTEVVTLGSGYEQRNAVWANSRRKYDAGYGVKSLDDIHAVIAFFEARMGKLYGFRFKDFSDYKSCAPLQAVAAADQTIGGGDGATTAFQLKKLYASGSYSWSRTIMKPVDGSVVIAVAGAELTSGWSFDSATGIVAFAAAPAKGAAITAGFEFDVPVRFDTDALSINLAAWGAGDIPAIPIVEIRL
jgi:uncharacterized protein (TIGR02217 family)